MIVGLLEPKSQHLIASSPLELIDRWPSFQCLSQLITRSVSPARPGWVVPVSRLESGGCYGRNSKGDSI